LKSITPKIVINTIQRVPTAEAIHIGHNVAARARHSVPIRVGLDAQRIFKKSFKEILSICFHIYIFLINKNSIPMKAASSSQKYPATNGSKSLDICTIIITAKADKIHEIHERMIHFRNQIGSK